MTIHPYDMINGSHIHCGFCTVVQPTLKRIGEVNYPVYESYMNLFFMTLESFLKATGREDTYSSLSKEQREEIKLFDIFIAQEETVAALRDAIQFFTDEKVVFDKKTASFLFFSQGKQVGALNRDNFEQMRKVIFQVTCTKYECDVPPKYKNERAKSIWGKLKAGREKMQKKHASATDEQLTLWNLMGAMSIYSNSYNLTNIGNLTVYQFYDQFNRMTTKIPFESIKTKWSIWSKKNDFDYSVWYRSVNLNGG